MLRRKALRLLPVALAGLLVGAIGQQLAERLWAALLATLAGASVAVLIALIFVIVFAGSYPDDRTNVRRGLTGAWPYVIRATTWGVAAAGVGALLATALPARITAADTNASAIPIAGWLAIFFGALGITLAILEEWHSGHGSSTSDPEA